MAKCGLCGANASSISLLLNTGVCNACFQATKTQAAGTSIKPASFALVAPSTEPGPEARKPGGVLKPALGLGICAAIFLCWGIWSGNYLRPYVTKGSRLEPALLFGDFAAGLLAIAAVVFFIFFIIRIVQWMFSGRRQ